MPSYTKRFNASLEFDVAQALEKHARRHHLSYSLAINNALKQALFPEHQEERNAALMASLDRIEYQLKELRVRQRDDATLLKEMLGTFVRVWFNNTAPVPKEHRSSAARSGNARFERYLDRVVDQIDRQNSVFDRAPNPDNSGNKVFDMNESPRT
ncbi:hypothetical protein [Salinisphaera orenii]|uniref:hypothetical protein n=1 Tax=Salinisphaera orenii TaxID=856731 RepID=UPI0011CDC83E|nr:hypothetical protein [Salinisphaera halophila]